MNPQDDAQSVAQEAMAKRLADSIDLSRKLVGSEPTRVEMDFAFAVQLSDFLASQPTSAEDAVSLAGRLEALAGGVEAIFAETVDGRGWSLELLFGKGDDARDRMRAVSDALRSQPVAAPQAEIAGGEE